METRSSTKITVAARLTRVAALLAVAGCGGGGGGGAAASSCGKVQPCGGSVIGTWTIASECDSPTNFTAGQACPAATIDESQLKASGSLAFNPDMTWTASVSLSGTIRFSVPLDCEPQGLTSCGELAGSVVPAPPDATTTCTTMGTTCNCAIVYAGTMTTSNSGTYSTAGNILTSTDSTGFAANVDYCVQAKTLHLIGVDSTTGGITNDVVATR